MEVIAGRFVVDASWSSYVGEMSKVVRAADTQNSLAKVAENIRQGCVSAESRSRSFFA